MRNSRDLHLGCFDPEGCLQQAEVIQSRSSLNRAQIS